MEFDDFFIRRASLAIALIGLAGIAFISFMSKPIETEIQNLSPEFIGKTVSVEGKVSSTRMLSNALSFELTENNAKIKAIIFNPKEKELLLIVKGARLKITGTISEFNGEIEIIAREVNEENA